jgi:hypothetical protein
MSNLTVTKKLEEVVVQKEVTKFNVTITVSEAIIVTALLGKTSSVIVYNLFHLLDDALLDLDIETYSYGENFDLSTGTILLKPRLLDLIKDSQDL